MIPCRVAPARWCRIFLSAYDGRGCQDPVVVCRDANLHFVEQVALKPPEVVIDTVQQAAYEQQLAEAANAPLPDEDDDIAE